MKFSTILALSSRFADVAVPEVEQAPEPVQSEMLLLYPRLRDQLNKGRTPKKSNSIYFTSPFRPQVLASERLFFWVSDASLVRRRLLIAKNQPPAVVVWDNALRALYAEGTLSAYGSGVVDWIRWCDASSIPEPRRLPIVLDDLRMFIAHKVGVEGASKTNGVLSALQAWHMVQDVPWCGVDDKLVTAFRRGVATHAPPSTRTPPRPPITLAHLRALASFLNLSDPFDSAVFGLACTCFWGLCRLGELTVPSLKDKEPTHRVLRNCRLSVDWATKSSLSCSSLDLHLPWTKTTRAAGGNVHLSEWNDCLDISATTALIWHLRLNWNVPDSAPLFSYCPSSSSLSSSSSSVPLTASFSTWTPMTKSAFLVRCRDVWAQSGLGDCSGHSFRIGGTTELLKRGVSHDTVKLQGRWASDAWLIYIRDHPDIIELEYARAKAALSL